MHYRNGREAKNGDKVLQFEMSSNKLLAVGHLIEAVPGQDFCNGKLVVGVGHSGTAQVIGACLCDCLHVDDVQDLLAEKGLDKRPAGK